MHPLIASSPFIHSLRRSCAFPLAVNLATATCLALAIGLAGSAHAAAVTYTGTVSSPQGINNFPCFSPANAGNGSGLSMAIVDGVTPWTITSMATHASSSCTSGFTYPSSTAQYTLDLGTARTIDMLGLWGTDLGTVYNPAQYTFKLTADNQPAWGNPLASQLGVFTDLGSSLAASAMQSFAFSNPVTARYLHLDYAAAGGSLINIGELAVREATQVPEPRSLPLAGLCLTALGWVRRLRSSRGRATGLAAAGLLAIAAVPAHAGYITWAPGFPYTLTPAGLPTVLGNQNSGGTPTGNPNVVTAGTVMGPGTSVSLHTYDDPDPSRAETEYELVWKLTNPFVGSPMHSISFWTQTFGNLLQYDGGPSTTVLDSTPWATQGALVPGSWTASGMVFDMGPGGLGGGQSATFHLPLDVLGLGNGSSAASNVMAQGSFSPLPPTAVPEPGALALCGLALVAMAGMRRAGSR